jgi:hypothetical protein
VLVLTATVGAAAWVLAHAAWAAPGWTALQVAVVALLAADVGGGLVDNATDSARRWWHRPGRRARHHLLFLAAHVHPFVLVLVLGGPGWRTAAGTYAATLVIGAAVLLTPPHLRRPVAFGCYAAAVTALSTLGTAPGGLEWFAPLLLLKLLLAHLLPDLHPDPR